MVDQETIQIEVPTTQSLSSIPVSGITDISSEQTIPHKIHIRGVDDLTTEDIKAFSTQHYPSDPPTRIEWIDDTSANIVYDTPATAFKALTQFTLESSGDVSSIPILQLRAAKSFSTHPESSLQVRTALISDQKRPRAYEASRFYMMHPEYDPRERRRRERSSHDGHGDYRRRRYGKEEQRRRKKADDSRGFDASMYDDDASALAARENGISSRRGSRSTLSSEGEPGSGGEAYARSGRKQRGDSYRPGRYGKDLSRDRSASPGKDSGNDDSNSKRRAYKRRTPPPRYKSRDPNPFPRENSSKELFPSKSTPALDIGADLRGSSSTTTAKELFPNKKLTPNLKKELFPLKSGTSVHRRSDAFDAADETADLFATGMTVPFVDGATDKPSNPRSLADRITDPSSSLSTYGRLKNSDPDPDPEALQDLANGGFSIRGAAKQQDVQVRGFSIRGLAADGTANGAVNNGNSSSRELFPGKALGNAGKELFAEKLQGRGGRRNKAADMFY